MSFFSFKSILGSIIGRVVGTLFGGPIGGQIGSTAGSLLLRDGGKTRININSGKFELAAQLDVTNGREKKLRQKELNDARREREAASGQREPIILVVKDPKTKQFVSVQRIVEPADTGPTRGQLHKQQRQQEKAARQAERQRQRSLSRIKNPAIPPHNV